MRFLERVFHKLLLNFTWWVNPQGPRGQQPVPGRFPRARQHRRVRPQPRSPGRRLHRAGRRHQLDGDVLPEHAAHRPRVELPQRDLPGPGDEVLRALSLHRRRDGEHRRRGRQPVGRRRRVLLRRAARRAGTGAAEADVPDEAALDGRPDPAVRRRGARRRAARSRSSFPPAHGLVPPEPAGPGEAGVALARAGERGRRTSCRCCAATG